MILFIAPYPNEYNEKDGMIQRIAAIDNLVADCDRKYLEISFRKYWFLKKEKKSINLTVLKLNFFVYFFLILWFILKAKVIYVHSIYNSLKILPFYFMKDVITDIHGVVPEELKDDGKIIQSYIYQFVEKIVAKHSEYLIVVTTAMKKHFLIKYQDIKAIFLMIPIFDETVINISLGKYSDRISVIYAGGVQKWQNVDKMLLAIKQVQQNVQYIILSGNQEIFKEKLKTYGIVNNVLLNSVPKEEVYSYYAKADLGFVLRENNIVNRVACPTKLIEYMSYGVVPIVLQPDIGDFFEYGYSYVLLEDFLLGKLPSSDEFERMRNNNFSIIKNVKTLVNNDLHKLLRRMV